MRKTCLHEIYKLAKKDKRVIFIGSDISQGGSTEEFVENIPEQFFMEGITEQHLIGMMTGLAMSGKVPYLNTLATFITRRCFEQLMIDAGLHQQPIRIVGSGGGGVYAPLGPTHVSMEDIAVLRVIPHMTIIAPSDAEEMKRLIPQTLDYPDPIYIRLAKGGDPIISKPENEFRIGKAIELVKGTEVILIGTGVTTKIVLDTAEELKVKGVSATVLHYHTLKPFDTQTLHRHLQQAKVVVTIEEHCNIGGLGSVVAEEICLSNPIHPIKFSRIAFPNRFYDDHGSQKSLMEKYGITQEAMIQEVCRLLDLSSHA